MNRYIVSNDLIACISSNSIRYLILSKRQILINAELAVELGQVHGKELVRVHSNLATQFAGVQEFAYKQVVAVRRLVHMLLQLAVSSLKNLCWYIFKGSEKKFAKQS